MTANDTVTRFIKLNRPGFDAHVVTAVQPRLRLCAAQRLASNSVVGTRPWRYNPIVVSASALAKASPTEPIEGTSPDKVRVPPSRTEVYRETASVR